MYKSFSKSQARRRLRRLLALVSQGQTFVITKHGKVACLLLEEKRVGSVKCEKLLDQKCDAPGRIVIRNGINAF
ncbi:hypothetical protein D9M71_606710 [compost metagenome]